MTIECSCYDCVQARITAEQMKIDLVLSRGDNELLAKAIAKSVSGDLPKKFPRRIYVKEYSMHGNGDWFWKSLCVVYDNEALGFLERLLEIEHKSEPC